ncbi:hypothetical protein PT974_01412 [Cladobotryum mycophilum]|uniref:Uncharacterized protein n=1 Tax=Cladobotryum mycophilum TaxID=491253 RepID=A0ABR0T3K0_9HYPO
MPEAGAAALSGQREHIDGWHDFTVEDQTLVIAEGMLIKIYAPGEDRCRWHGRITGEEGQPVSRGDKVEVYKVDVEFRT